ncbi:flagellar export protein FliJ [Methylomonas sp. AM2-LC]|uniref:flagellar export protein FliJ n=1 Tax=Methylomonas sp. AM2-LC TaxID=3153301 RepID=UPI003267E865
MSKRSERLKVIIDLYSRQEHDALQFLGRTQQKLTEQQTQLEQLQKYRLENRAGLAQQQAAGLTIMQFQELRAFADKLDKAIAGQQTLLANYEQDLHRARKNWEESHHRTQSMEKISAQAKAEELKAENRREQIEMDARATRTQRKDGI